MNKKLLCLCISLLLFSCGNKTTSSNNDTSSSNNSINETSINEYLETVYNAYDVNLIYEDYNNNSKMGYRNLYLNQDEIKVYGMSNLIFQNEEITNDSFIYYFADNEGYVYQEELSPNNEINNKYILSSNKKILFNNSFVSIFSIIKNENFSKGDDNKYYFTNENLALNFVNQFLTGSIDVSSSYFIFKDNDLSYHLTNSSFNLTLKLNTYGKDNIHIDHIKKFELDNGDKFELKLAIDELKNNYLVTHYRTGNKTKIYYVDNTILLDNAADGLSSQDSYYYYKDNEEVMTRLVFGTKHVVGAYSWDEENYQEMDYVKTTFDDLKIRLDKINLGFFKNNNDGTYTSIEGAASLLFPYCQPSMNVRQLYVDNATSVTIQLKEGHISKIKLSYIYNVYSEEGYEKTDTIVFNQIGNVTIPQNYYESININHDVIIPDELTGTYEGTYIKKVDGVNKENKVRLTINSDCSAKYEINETSYNIPLINYSKYDDGRIVIGFDYNDNKRSISFGYISSNNSFEGSDSSLENIYDDFFNITLTKIV